MITQEQINTYAEIQANEGREAADAFASSLIKQATPAERGKAWAAIRSACPQPAPRKPEPQRKPREPIANIRAICLETLGSLKEASRKERIFLNSISANRALTEKQESWLRDLASAAGVEIHGKIKRRRCKKPQRNPATCEHEDLRSLGYDGYVKCPHCGSMTHVW